MESLGLAEDSEVYTNIPTNIKAKVSKPGSILMQMNAFLTWKTNELWQYQLAFLWWLIDSLHKFPLLYYWGSLSLSRCSPFAQARNGFQFFGSPPLCQCYPTSHTRHQLRSIWISNQNLNWFTTQSCSASTCGTWTLNKTDVYKLNFFIRLIILPTSMLNSMEKG